MYCASAYPGCSETDGCYWESVQTDPTGTIAWITEGTNEKLRRLDLSDPSNPVITNVLQGAGFSVLDFAVNSTGDALVHEMWDGGATHYTRVYEKSGGITDISSLIPPKAFSSQMTGFEDSFYFSDAGTPTRVYASGANYTSSAMGGTAELGSGTGPNQIVRFGTKIYSIVAGTNNTYYWADVSDNSGGSGTVTGLTKILQVSGDSSQLYFLGEDGSGNHLIVKWDFSTFTTVLAAGEYEVHLMDASPGGDVTFAGLRNSDSVEIVGNIAAGTSEVTLVKEFSSAPKFLKRLN